MQVEAISVAKKRQKVAAWQLNRFEHYLLTYI